MWKFSREAREERKRDREREERLLLRAAATSETYLVCHPHTWDFITEWCLALPHQGHFAAPDGARVQGEPRGRIRVPVSGRTLAYIVDTMRLAALPGSEVTVDRASAQHVYQAIELALNTEGVIQLIVIDPHPGDEQIADEVV